MTNSDTGAQETLATAAGEAAEAAQAADAAQAAEAEAAEESRIYAEARQLAFDLLFVQGLYASVDKTTAEGEAVETNIRYNAFAFDAYCVSCKRETTFRVSTNNVTGRGIGTRYETEKLPSLLAVKATC